MIVFRKIIKAISIAIIILLFFLISEAIFYFNNPQNLIPLTLKENFLSDKLSKQLVLFNTSLIINQNKKNYPKVIPANYNLFTNYSNINLSDHLEKYLDNPNEGQPPNQSNLSKVFYNSAVNQYKSGNSLIFPIFLEIAYYVNPTLSYWPIEWANFEYLSGNKDKAVEILLSCTKTPEPREHCEKYLELIENSVSANQPGFLQNEIEEYFISASI